jgi:hypothetical protein
VAEEIGDPIRDKGFKARKREDHALVLIRELRENIKDGPKVRIILRELGRYYDPVLGGAIMDLSHRRAILEALETGREAEALATIDERYRLYIKDRAHLGRGED